MFSKITNDSGVLIFLVTINQDVIKEYFVRWRNMNTSCVNLSQWYNMVDLDQTLEPIQTIGNIIRKSVEEVSEPKTGFVIGVNKFAISISESSPYDKNEINYYNNDQLPSCILH